MEKVLSGAWLGSEADSVTRLPHGLASRAAAAREECGLFWQGGTSVLFTTENEYRTLCEKHICH